MKHLLFVCLFIGIFGFSQHKVTLEATLDVEGKGFQVAQEIIYKNETESVLKEIVLNDWNNAYASKNSPLAKRFSDEYYRAFHLAKESDRGFTNITEVLVNGNVSKWNRFNDQIDLVVIPLKNPLAIGDSISITLQYFLKVANARFTDFGFKDDNSFNLKYWYISPALFTENGFVRDSNENLDDISNATHYLDATLKNCNSYFINSNLQITKDEALQTAKIAGFVTKDVVLVLNNELKRNQYKNEIITVENSIESKLDEVNKAIIVDQITRFVADYIPTKSVNKIIVTNEDYKRQPFYGLNQLPSFFSPFSDNFIYELKFLKTYINNYLDETLHLNARSEYWLHDGIQVYLMMEYVKQFHPDIKMSGKLADLKILKSYHFITLDFNQQYNYLYLLMARKNLDQSLLEPKNRLIKFNEQISSKYKAGLSLNYLQEYLGGDIVKNTIKELVASENVITTAVFQNSITSKTNTDLDWFFDEFLSSRQIIDYTFGRVKKTNGSTSIVIRNKSNVTLPMPLYYFKDDVVVKKEWLKNVSNDTLISFNTDFADKLVLNHNNEVPEFDLRNNYKSLKGFFSNNKPIKFVFYEDLENPKYSQIFFVPEFNFNLYDGLATGMKFDNKSMLNKDFTFSTTPSYSPKTRSIVGKFGVTYRHNIRDTGKLYRINYNINGSKFHYAENAAYTTFNPSIQVFFRDPNFRVNKNEYIFIRQQFINREASPFVEEGSNLGSYNLFQAGYANIQSEATKTFGFSNGVQISNNFAKLTSEVTYRRLFENNQRISLRLFAGTFMYKDTQATFFDFGIDRPTDYSFDSNLIGRSESSGLASQQFINSEAAFKSKLDVRFANQWITAVNASTNVWNWIEVYGDVGLVKNNYKSTQFIFDSGIHLNLVPDYFELFLPVYSSNGFELKERNYGERIRFIVTLSPKTLLSLFTRKWF